MEDVHNNVTIISSPEESEHDRMVKAALTSQAVVLLERVEFDQDITSVESQPDQQGAVRCIKNEPVDVLETGPFQIPGNDRQGLLVQDDMSLVDLKPTDVEIQVPHGNENLGGWTETLHTTKSKLSNKQIARTDRESYQFDQSNIQTNTTLVKLHTSAHTRVKQHNCDQCDFMTVISSDLTRHIRAHTGDDPHKCDQCDYQAVWKGSVTRHLRTHTLEKPYQCGQCDYKAADKRNLNIHIRVHTGEKPYKCDQCDYQSVRKGSATRHHRTHTGVKLYRCDQCMFVTATSSNLTHHMSTHSDKPKRPSSLLRSLLEKSPSHQSPNTGSGSINSAGTVGTLCNQLPITASTPIASTIVNPTSRAEHSDCSAKIQELTQIVEKSIERKDADCLSSEDHSISRSTYACLHKEFDVLEKWSSPHNSAVSILYMKALTAHGFSKKQCLKLIRQCFKRLKHAARPKSNKEIACRQKVRKKDFKLVYRKRKQNDTEKGLYPITYEMMSSEDEDEQGPFRHVKSFLTDETREHIEELDRRARKAPGARTKVKECQPSLKLIGNRCVIY